MSDEKHKPDEPVSFEAPLLDAEGNPLLGEVRTVYKWTFTPSDVLNNQPVAPKRLPEPDDDSIFVLPEPDGSFPETAKLPELPAELHLHEAQQRVWDGLRRLPLDIGLLPRIAPSLIDWAGIEEQPGEASFRAEYEGTWPSNNPQVVDETAEMTPEHWKRINERLGDQHNARVSSKPMQTTSDVRFVRRMVPIEEVAELYDSMTDEQRKQAIADVRCKLHDALFGSMEPAPSRLPTLESTRQAFIEIDAKLRQASTRLAELFKPLLVVTRGMFAYKAFCTDYNLHPLHDCMRVDNARHIAGITDPTLYFGLIILGIPDDVSPTYLDVVIERFHRAGRPAGYLHGSYAAFGKKQFEVWQTIAEAARTQREAKERNPPHTEGFLDIDPIISATTARAPRREKRRAAKRRRKAR